MKYRKLTATGDYSFGHRAADFYVDSPDAVAQAVQTRLLLIQGEWFLDTTAGTPYFTRILGTGTQRTCDQAIQDVIIGTEGVLRIDAYSSDVNPVTRALTAAATITTVYGQATVTI